MGQEPEDVRFHVSPSVNRESIRRFGLDWNRMTSTEPGIASGRPGQPEIDGIFLTEADSDSARFFVRFGRGRRVDVWRVDVTGFPVEPGPDGWWVCRAVIPTQRLELLEVWDTDPDNAFGDPTALPLPRARADGRKTRR
jgi:hypothetical protein